MRTSKRAAHITFIYICTDITAIFSKKQTPMSLNQSKFTSPTLLLPADNGPQQEGDRPHSFDYMAAEERVHDDEAGAKEYIDALVEQTAPGCYAQGLASLTVDAEAAPSLQARLPVLLSSSWSTWALDSGHSSYNPGPWCCFGLSSHPPHAS